jgi:SAM-dependent methyltransferase
VDFEAVLPDQILEIGYAFWKSKALLSAVELGLFSVLADGALEYETLVARLKLHGRGARDFFDALVALKLLRRHPDGRYANSPETNFYLDRRKPSYIGDLLDLLNARLYQSWSLLTRALRTGRPNGSLGTGYSTLYGDQSTLEIFLKAMTGGSLHAAKTIAVRFPWANYRTVIDIGTAQGCLPVEIARAHSHLTGGGFDLPFVEPSFTDYVRTHGLNERLKFFPGDFINDPLPAADVLVMGRILHNWDLPTKKLLVKKVFQALRPGGAIIVYDNFIDNERRVHAHSLLASLNMLIETPGGFEYTAADCMGWMEEVGFRKPRVEPLGSLHSALIGLKN